jgi:hypothetical protein
MREETNADFRPDPPAAKRAAAALGVPGNDPAAARAAFLRRLPAAGFVPPPEWRAAVRALTGRPAPGPGALPDAGDAPDDDGPRAEVEAFAAAFWSLAPAERRARWQDLLDRCAGDPPLAARLRRLEGGVDLDAIPPGSGRGRVQELASVLQELFVLRPAERAARRRERLGGLSGPATAWAAAVRQLQVQYPAVASLDPPLIGRLGTLTHRPTAPAPRPPAGPAWEVSARWVFLGLGLLLGTLLRFSDNSTTTLPSRIVPAPPRIPVPPPFGPSGVVPGEDLLGTRPLKASPIDDPRWQVPALPSAGPNDPLGLPTDPLRQPTRMPGLFPPPEGGLAPTGVSQPGGEPP